MKKKDVIKYFGSVRAVSDVFKVSTQAVYAWSDLVPETVALKAEKITGGKLKYSEKAYAAD